MTLPADSDSKKRTITLTPKLAAAASDKRAFSTRAKEAARRAGRSLFEAAPVPASETPAPASTTATAKAQSRRRSLDVNENQRPPREGNNQSITQTQPSGVARGDSQSGRRIDRRGDSQHHQQNDKSSDKSDVGHNRRRARPVDTTRAVVRAAPSPAPVREPDGTVRISKLLSEQGLCSRREADSYIARGWVWADGERVTELGKRVLPTAVLKLDQSAAQMQESRMTILLNKPMGYVSGQAEDGYQPASVLATSEHQMMGDFTPFRPEHRRGLAPAGRLDIDSTGLLVLTQDGRIAKQLIGENSEVEKEYLVRVEGTLDADGLRLLNHGLSLDGEALKPAKVRWQNEDQLNFILQEGKKRQIRRMCEMVGLKVVGLKRIRIGRIKLGDLPVGKWRFMRSDESF